MMHINGFRKRWDEPRGPLFVTGTMPGARALGYFVLWSQFDGLISHSTPMCLDEVRRVYYS
jgi:hypothetical protein